MAIKQQKRDAANSYTRSEAHVIPFVTDSGFTRTEAGSRKRVLAPAVYRPVGVA